MRLNRFNVDHSEHSTVLDDQQGLRRVRPPRHPPSEVERRSRRMSGKASLHPVPHQSNERLHQDCEGERNGQIGKHCLRYWR